MLFEEALAARLAVMSPSRASLDAFLRDHPPLITPGATSSLLYILHCSVYCCTKRLHAGRCEVLTAACWAAPRGCKRRQVLQGATAHCAGRLSPSYWVSE